MWPKGLPHRSPTGDPGRLDFLPAPDGLNRTAGSPIGRAISVAIMAFVAIAIAWAVLAEMDVVVSAQGRVVPTGRIKLIQPLEPGVIKAIHVREGQSVRSGDLLIELDPTSSTADRERLAREWKEAATEVARLEAQLRGDGTLSAPEGADTALLTTQTQLLLSRLGEQKQKLTVLDNDIARRRADRDAAKAALAKLEEAQPLLVKRFEAKESLARRRFAPEMSAIDAKLELIHHEKETAVQRHRHDEAIAGVVAALGQRGQAEEEFRARTLSELTEAAKRRDGAYQELIKAQQRTGLQTLRAPVDGVVQQLAVSTVGGVVTTAQQLLVVVPIDAGMEVEAQVLNKDIGFVRVGQDAAVKFETYEFTRYGTLDGKIQWVGTDAVTDQKLGPVYPIRIALADSRMPREIHGERGAVTPGMTVTADVVIGKRRAIDYFLAPILRYKNESLRER